MTPLHIACLIGNKDILCIFLREAQGRIDTSVLDIKKKKPFEYLPQELAEDQEILDLFAIEEEETNEVDDQYQENDESIQ